MGDRINKGFLQEKLMYGCFARWPKNWPYCQGGHKAGFHCSCLNYFKPFLFCRLILSMVLHNLWGETLNHQKVIIQQWTGKENWKKKTSSCWQNSLETSRVILCTKKLQQQGVSKFLLQPYWNCKTSAIPAKLLKSFGKFFLLVVYQQKKNVSEKASAFNISDKI